MVELLYSSVPIFQNIDKKILRQIYYKHKYRLYNSGEVLFDLGETCRSIFILAFGRIEIQLTDGDKSLFLDSLGVGSVIGMYGVVTGFEWDYKAIIRGRQAILIEIDVSVIN